MRRLLRLLRNGKGLRHLPVIFPARVDVSIRVSLRGISRGAIDVTNDHVPVSLRPFVLGIHLDEAIGDATTPSLELRDVLAHDRLLARIELKPAGAVALSKGELRLFETAGCQNRSTPAPRRWVRYALAWQHARRASSRGDGLCMSASDLRCLNAYYIAARPVYLVSAAYGDRVNVFPMDLVGAVSTGDFLLALRATSPSIELIESSRRIAMSGAPARALESVYALGQHHHEATIDLRSLPFEMQASSRFGLPVLAGSGSVSELSVQDVHRIGSHVLFVARVERESGHTEEQLAHVSGMYAEWLERHDRPLQSLASA